MQHSQTGAFLCTLAQQTQTSKAREALMSYLSGFLCHYCLDRTTHPYIIFFSGMGRGDHMRMEHALDIWSLRQWGEKPWHFPILRKILAIRKLPDCMQPDIDAVYEKVYGWKQVFKDTNRGLRDQRRLYLMAQDPLGLLDTVLQHLDNGITGHDLTAISYHGKERPDLDILNEGHALWHHPQDPSITSTESFPELMEHAAQDAIGMLKAVWSGAAGVTLAQCIGDASYETGFPWQDIRNHLEPICHPLPFTNKAQKG